MAPGSVTLLRLGTCLEVVIRAEEVTMTVSQGTLSPQPPSWHRTLIHFTQPVIRGIQPRLPLPHPEPVANLCIVAQPQPLVE